MPNCGGAAHRLDLAASTSRFLSILLLPEPPFPPPFPTGASQMAERAAALAIERQKAEQRAREAAQLATLSKAATMLQKIWRGSQGRKAAEKGKAGKGKGKKKKVRGGYEAKRRLYSRSLSKSSALAPCPP